ncbi:uncharacterized protein [Macrobrachium rosenbergii]|uniref:uncharacterized protein n=1 Tax=Macrobrachium rosenbergii TaxID=79674 RepID=UPI0034D72C74
MLALILIPILCLGWGQADVRTGSQLYELPETPFLVPSIPPHLPNDIPGCSGKTSYLTITSTRPTTVLVYKTVNQYVPSKVFEVITASEVRFETVFATQTYTTYLPPKIVTETEFLTVTTYKPHVQLLTETVYATKREVRSITTTEVVTDYRTRTSLVYSKVTVTSTGIVTTEAVTSVNALNTKYQYFTKTSYTPNTVVFTRTTTYNVYQTLTHTLTKNEYITETKLQYSTFYTTKCSSSYVYQRPSTAFTHYDSFGGY